MSAGNDVNVFSRDMLDAEHAARFHEPWLVQWAGGHIRQCCTEELACAVQRAWRLRVGLNPETGEIIKRS